MNIQARTNGTSARARPNNASPEPARCGLSKAKSSPNVSKLVKLPPAVAKLPRARNPGGKVAPPSCSILEDRALLKRGLAKPLNRSTSLWNVKSPDKKASPCSPRSRKPALNRSTSLWSVRNEAGGFEPRRPRAKVISGARPSRIPLATYSSWADIPGKCRTSVDEVDRSLDEEHIYENLKRDDAVIDKLMREIDKERKTAPKKPPEPGARIDLDKRVEMLMSQLDEDEDEDRGKGAKKDACIQEIRRNWEEQIKRSQEEKRASLKKVARVEKKEIKELVNFFNGRNGAEGKEMWKKDAERSSGYVSDGNCSEDSGHISNENDLEHQEEKGSGKGERFLEEIIQDLDASLEKTISGFDNAMVSEMNQRNMKSFKSVSSSSIDSWGSEQKKGEGWKVTLPDDSDDESKIVANGEGYRAQVKARLGMVWWKNDIFFNNK